MGKIKSLGEPGAEAVYPRLASEWLGKLVHHEDKGGSDESHK